jgi:phage terminase large subunit GpA-like protein
MGNPKQSKTWRDLDDKLDTVYKFKNGIGLKSACTCVDSGGHFTTEVYKYCKKNENKRIFAVKGQGGPGIPLIHRLYRSKKENAAVFILGVDSGKSTIMSRLKLKNPEDGEGYCHFPLDESRGYSRTYFKGLISEKLVISKTKKGVSMVWEKINGIKRNEPFDLRNYAQAALYILKPNFETLEKRLKNIKIPEEKEAVKQPKPPPRRRGVVNKGIQI